MIVGTASNSGKTLITAGLCRYFSRRGLKVMPYKAQNMSLNSFVTAEGGEIGRAQAFQARACGVKPHTDMNPVLLKPLGDCTSQIVINGKAYSNMSAGHYYDNSWIVNEAFAALDRLMERCDLVIMEGAGSPAEINIEERDFVNMRAAAHAGASVLLVADIDRGGVFASIYGTVKLVKPSYQSLFKGIIINKFRGDKALLGSGPADISKLCGVPVLGVMPFLNGLTIEEEDSVVLDYRKSTGMGSALIDIAVIKLPRMSNYTDFLALETEKSVSLRYISSVEELGGTPDLVIIPGSKNTIEDMRFLNESGLAACIIGSARKGIPVFGICGGFQMLGLEISDPFHVEGETANTPGLGLLPLRTELRPHKELAQVKGTTLKSFRFAAPGTPFTGYEIHCGVTTPLPAPDNAALAINERGTKNGLTEATGVISGDGLVFGTYVHGIFDSDNLRAGLIQYLHSAKGVEMTQSPCGVSYEDAVEKSIDAIALAIAENIDTSYIRALIR